MYLFIHNFTIQHQYLTLTAFHVTTGLGIPSAMHGILTTIVPSATTLTETSEILGESVIFEPVCIKRRQMLIIKRTQALIETFG